MQDWAKIELHCHLEGAFRAATLLKLNQLSDPITYADMTLQDYLPEVCLLGQSAPFSGEGSWFEKFVNSLKPIQTQEDLARLTYDCIDDAHNDGIIYRELRYAPYFIEDLTPLSKEEGIEAILEGQRRAAVSLPVHTELIMIAQQSDGIEKCETVVDLALKYNHVAVDIAGLQNDLPLETYILPMRHAKENGLHITIHSGEFEGAESVRVAVEQLGADRIGHGFRATEDDAVMALLAERKMHMEVNVSSNLQTNVVPNLHAHPFPQMMAAGLPISINTDDPAIQGITLTSEYEKLVKADLLTKEQLHQANLDAIDAAFTSEDVKATLREAVNTSYAE